MNQSEKDFLLYIENGNMNGFDCMRTGRMQRLSTAKSLESKGLVRSLYAVVCDDDGFPRESGREALCWELTEDGRSALEAVET